MRWVNRGHELDEYIKDLPLYSNFKYKYYIFGAGLFGRELQAVLRFYGCPSTFIDNSIDKQGGIIEGSQVISIEDYLRSRDAQIVVAASAKNTPDIVKQLEQNLLEHKTDFFLFHEFINFIFPIISVYCYDKSYVALAQISLTERCSLKCKNCAHGCYAVDNSTVKDLNLEQVYKSADSFFFKVDYIKEFVLIGGEPLLYKNLVASITYIGERYRRRIGIYSITTNGTIIPDEKLLEACKKYNVLFRISNYGRQLPRLKENYAKLITILKKENVSFILSEEEAEWVDYGFGNFDRNLETEKLIEAFDACKTPCREVRENRFYFCVMARSVSDNLGYYVGQDDYLDLDDLNGEDRKKRLLEFTLGYSEKGYLDMCNYCRGAEAKNYPVPAAEQILKPVALQRVGKREE